MDTNSPQTGNIDDDGASLDRPFDQTNDAVAGLEGDSDGTADSDTESRADRKVEDSVTDIDPEQRTGKD
jgi:hypothetical protein